MLRWPCASKAQATRDPCLAAIRSLGKGELRTCSIENPLCVCRADEEDDDLDEDEDEDVDDDEDYDDDEEDDDRR